MAFFVQRSDRPTQSHPAIVYPFHRDLMRSRQGSLGAEFSEQERMLITFAKCALTWPIASLVKNRDSCVLPAFVSTLSYPFEIRLTYRFPVSPWCLRFVSQSINTSCNISTRYLEDRHVGVSREERKIVRRSCCCLLMHVWFQPLAKGQ